MKEGGGGRGLAGDKNTVILALLCAQPRWIFSHKHMRTHTHTQPHTYTNKIYQGHYLPKLQNTVHCVCVYGCVWSV